MRDAVGRRSRHAHVVRLDAAEPAVRAEVGAVAAPRRRVCARRARGIARPVGRGGRRAGRDGQRGAALGRHPPPVVEAPPRRARHRLRRAEALAAVRVGAASCETGGAGRRGDDSPAAAAGGRLGERRQGEREREHRRSALDCLQLVAEPTTCISTGPSDKSGWSLIDPIAVPRAALRLPLLLDREECGILILVPLVGE